jgi:dipeptidyl aminopeptidase/acylaminoacyl peptidase
MSHDPLMRRLTQPIRCSALIVASVLSLTAQSFQPVTVADTIAMTQVVDEGSGLHDFMQLSPNGEHFAVVLEHGEILTDKRVFSLLVFRTSGVFNESAQIVAALASSSNEDAIRDVRWLNDQTLTFLGTTEQASSQVYAVNINTKHLRQLTAHRKKINAYAVSPGLDRVIYTADADLTEKKDELRKHGFVVTDQSLTDILMGNFVSARLKWRDLDYELPQETFVEQSAPPKIIEISDGDNVVALPNPLFPYSRNPVSPDGRYAVLRALGPAREAWGCFESPFPTTIDGSTNMTSFVLVDMDSGVALPLLDAPSSPYLTSIAWAPNSQSVVLVNTFLPSGTKNVSNCTTSTSPTVIAEVNISNRHYTVIGGTAIAGSVGQGIVCAQAIDWKADDNSLVLALSSSPDNRGGVCHVDELATYRKDESDWHQISVVSAESALRSTADGRITITLDQGPNTPPNLRATDHQTGRTKIFTDLNPQFRSRAFAPVTVIRWMASDGSAWSGNLYSPPDMKPGTRYPLVIQTHGCSTEKFAITGFDSDGATGYAAQVLAGKGIMVLQVGHCADVKQSSVQISAPYYSPERAEYEMRGYEAAIDFLDKHGRIDRDRVGLQGHSVTSWIVLYAVAHPNPQYRYAALLSTARDDLGYFAYLATEYGRLWSIKGNGGPPTGSHFSTFQHNALPFNLEHVNTPILSQEPDGIRYVPLMWEIHENLKTLHKPEELMIFPEGTHNLVKPWERLVSQQAAVDWFCFWLKGDQDPDPAKRIQYARWRAMRQLLKTNEVRNDLDH